MAAALQTGCRAAGHQDRKILVVVQAGISHAAPVQVNRVIQERPVSVRSRLHSLQKLRKQRNVIRIDLRDLRHLYRIVAVMARGMVRVGHADFRVRAIALLARQLECDYPRNVRLKGEDLQVEHQLRVVGECCGNPHRPVQIRRLVLRDRFLAPLDLSLHLPYAIEILIQARAILGAHAPFDLRDVRGERIEQACPVVQRGSPCGRIAAFTEQAFEDYPRMRLRRKRRRRRRPGEAILIDARVTVVAHAGERVQIHRELERGQLRLAAHLLGRDLVDCRAQIIIRALGVFGGRRAQERRVGGVVRPRIGVLQPHIGDDGHLIFDRLERARGSGKARRAFPGPAGSIAPDRTPSE